jgi:hypothetical protein
MFLSALHKSNPLASGGAVFAGSLVGTQGNSNATGSNALFRAPSRVVSDSNGNFYVSETSNHTIRKITRFGVVTTVFGTGSSGSSLTTLNSPRGLALDLSNNLYIADFSNSRILSISNGHTLGSNATLVASNVYNIDEIAVNSNGSNMVLKTNATSGQNLIQYRNGALDGLINTSQNSSVPNVASIASTPSGEFYYSTRNGQSLNYQISAYKMFLNPPTTYVLNVNNITQPNGVGGVYPVFLNVSADPVSLGFSIDQTFTLSEFSSASVNGFVGTITGMNVSAASNITFKYPGPLQNYPVGIPNPAASILSSSTNSGSNFRVLAIGWDTTSIGAGGPGTDSPGSVLRMNFYLGNATYDFPAITSNALDKTLSNTRLGTRFTGEFSIWNDQTLPEPVIYDFPYVYTVGGSGALSFTNTLSGTIYDSPVNGTILGPGVEPGTIITSYTAGSPGVITTNKAFAFLGNVTTTFRISGPAGATNIHTITDLSTTGLLIPGIRIDSGDGAFGATIIEVELDFSDRTKGTITTDYIFTANTNQEYVAKTRYDFAPWPGGSKRVVVTTFPAVGFPTIGTGGKVTSILINNNPTPLLTDGVYYGTFLKAMQFSKVDSSLLYAANQGYDGVTQYSVGGDTLIASDKNAEIPSVDSFAVFPSTSEIIAVVPQASSNNLQIYQNEY